MAKPTKSFVMVRSCSPREQFRRAGFVFTKEWRVLELGEKVDIEKGVVDAPTLKILEDEKQMLAVKPATADEAESFQKLQASNAGKDKDTIITELLEKNADLEARLMRLELAASGGKGTGKENPAKS